MVVIVVRSLLCQFCATICFLVLQTPSAREKARIKQKPLPLASVGRASLCRASALFSGLLAGRPAYLMFCCANRHEPQKKKNMQSGFVWYIQQQQQLLQQYHAFVCYLLELTPTFSSTTNTWVAKQANSTTAARTFIYT